MSNYYENDDEEEEEEKDEKDWIIWTKKPKWDKIFGNNFGKDFEMPDLEKIINYFIKQLNFPIDKESSDRPIVWGFSMNIGPDKKPKIKQFGNIKPKRKKKLIQGKHETLIDIIECDKEIIIIAEIPGVKKSDINLNATETSLNIYVDTPKQKYYNEITLPTEVVSKSIEVQYNNGILEVKLEKKKSN